MSNEVSTTVEDIEARVYTALAVEHGLGRDRITEVTRTIVRVQAEVMAELWEVVDVLRHAGGE